MPPSLQSPPPGARRGMAVLKLLLAVVGVVGSTYLFLSVFFRIDLTGDGPLFTKKFSFLQFVGQVPDHLGWLLPFMLLTAAILPLRALQWQRTLATRVPFRERYHLIGIGVFVHNVVPGKLGDLTRAFLLARTQRLPFVQALGSVAVCKLLEFCALMLLVALSLVGPFGRTLARFQAGLKVAVALCLTLVAVVVLLAHFSGPLAERLRRQGRLPKLQRFLQQAFVGLGTARSFRGLAVALVFSVGPVLASALAYGTGLTGLGIEGGLFAGAVVLGAISLGQATPGVPAGTGIYYFVTSWVARSLGASEAQAAAYAALTHLGTLTTMILVGAASVWIRKLRWRDLVRQGRMAQDATKRAADEPLEPARA